MFYLCIDKWWLRIRRLTSSVCKNGRAATSCRSSGLQRWPSPLGCAWNSVELGVQPDRLMGRLPTSDLDAGCSDSYSVLSSPIGEAMRCEALALLHRFNYVQFGALSNSISLTSAARLRCRSFVLLSWFISRRKTNTFWATELNQQSKQHLSLTSLR